MSPISINKAVKENTSDLKKKNLSLRNITGLTNDRMRQEVDFHSAGLTGLILMPNSASFS